MGKTQKPLTILVVDRDLCDSLEVQALCQKGHIIHCGVNQPLLGLDCYDVVIGPQCWRLDPALGNLDAQLTMMLAGVRAAKYPKEAT